MASVYWCEEGATYHGHRDPRVAGAEPAGGAVRRGEDGADKAAHELTDNYRRVTLRRSSNRAFMAMQHSDRCTRTFPLLEQTQPFGGAAVMNWRPFFLADAPC